MATVTRLGPADHGRAMTLDEYLHGDYQEGYRYELIDGRLYVSPAADMPHDAWHGWFADHLRPYTRQHPEVVNYLAHAPRVFVPGQPATTAPEPDLAVYQGAPESFAELDWETMSPVLVVEILSDDNPDKDLVRNVELYLQVPSIKEYWVLDPRENADEPTLTVYRRYGRRWRKPIVLQYGDTYTTGMLPGFTLCIDPRS
jgi:Uma2 family endonuclease